MSKWKIQGYDVQEVQEKIFDIFIEFDRICKKYELKYTLEGGSLLGAVLYKGFIPWDDDMDIIMLRKEYDKFCQIANKELPETYKFMTMEMSDHYPFLFGKIFDLNTIYMAQNTAHLDIPHGVFLDIFVEDNVELKTKKIQSRLVSAIGTVRYIKLGVEKFKIKHIFYAPLFMLDIAQLTKVANKVMRKYADRETAYVYPLCESVNSKPPLPRRMLTEFEKGMFNGKEVNIPVCHMWYLHKHYDTPMEIPPESSQHPTHGVIKIEL